MLTHSIFKKKDFSEVYNKIYPLVKKNFESHLDDIAKDELENEQGSESEDSFSDWSDSVEYISKQKNTLLLSHDEELIEIPLELMDIDNLTEIFNEEQYNQLFSEQEKEHLNQFLPQIETKQQQGALSELLKGNNIFFGNPLSQFLSLVKQGKFTLSYIREQKSAYQIYQNYMLDYYKQIGESLDKKVKNLTKPTRDEKPNLLLKRKALIYLEDVSSESDSSYSSLSRMSIENEFEIMSRGYTTYDSAGDEYYKATTFTELDVELQENRKIEEQKKLVTEASKAKRIESETMPTPTPKTSKAVKTVVNSKEQTEHYRKEEKERYQHPTKPWTYILEDKSKAVVAPVAKKISMNNAKPREHPLLKTDRPYYITILCLVRDAACRLPGGVGTRADICELLKQSQFINENIPDDKLSNIVSGALDRLHYENDPCVRYDGEKKLWIYLHKDRDESYPSWTDQTDARSSKKKEYNQKYKSKKKTTEDNLY